MHHTSIFVFHLPKKTGTLINKTYMIGRGNDGHSEGMNGERKEGMNGERRDRGREGRKEDWKVRKRKYFMETLAKVILHLLGAHAILVNFSPGTSTPHS